MTGAQGGDLLTGDIMFFFYDERKWPKDRQMRSACLITRDVEMTGGEWIATMKLLTRTVLPLDLVGNLVVFINSFLYEKLTDENFK
jgi:hypothetical protein